MTAPKPEVLPNGTLTDADADKILAALKPVKHRKVTKWKTVAKEALKLAGDRLAMLEAMSDTIIAERKALFAQGRVTARYRLACTILGVLLALVAASGYALVWR